MSEMQTVRGAIGGRTDALFKEGLALLAEAEMEKARLRAENEELRSCVIAFCAPHAATYARDHGLPDRHLFAEHYDILAKAGARMDDFVRSE